MDPYQKLLSNTVLFGISTFGSRFLGFLLTPFYTRVLSSTEYGVTDLLIQTGNLIIPIASAGIINAVIRYGLEQTDDKSGVFTTGLLVNLAGFFLLLAISPLLGKIEFLSDYLWLVLLYVLAANVHSVCNQFARTMGHVRLFALDGILRTALAIFFNILLLTVFPMGITGLYVGKYAGRWAHHDVRLHPCKRMAVFSPVCRKQSGYRPDAPLQCAPGSKQSLQLGHQHFGSLPHRSAGRECGQRHLCSVQQDSNRALHCSEYVFVCMVAFSAVSSAAGRKRTFFL